MKIILIGLGDIAQKAYLPIVSCIENIELGICTRNAILRNSLSKRYKANEVFTNYRDAIESCPDAIMIHSSTDSHFEIALAGLNAGIAVFIDKPVSYDIKQTEELLAISEQKNTPLMIGFNRRYAPLYQAPLNAQAIQLRYQKNRHNLPGKIREFIYDDFIHILDFALCASKPLELPTLNIFNRMKAGEIELLDVYWEHNGAHYAISMNRINGKEEERLEYMAENEKWEINQLSEGFKHMAECSSKITFGNWESTLYKRGFVTMVNKFISLVESKQHDSEMNHQVWQTHRLCEDIVDHISP